MYASMPSRGSARRKLGLPLDRPIVGYVGRFATFGRDKGVADLVAALAVPELRRLDPLLLCVGGPLGPVTGYEELARSLGIPSSSLRFVDRVPNGEVPGWLAAPDVAALPAPAGASGGAARAKDHYAGATSPMKLFEYMAAGLPIVAADLPGVRDVLEDGTSTRLVPPEDPGALGHALAAALADPDASRAQGDEARAQAQGHSWEARAERALAFALTGRAATVVQTGRSPGPARSVV
jgi:glycosyltransferase involved in cell wall biosynthesis